LSKIRVLQLGSPTGLYGAERWILALIKHLDPEKVESRVAVIKDDPSLETPLCREAERLGFSSYCIEAYGKVNFSAARQLRDLIRREDIDILHSHGYKTDLIGLLATRATKCKIISTPHGWSKQADFKLMCYEMLDRCAFPFFDAVVPLSDDLFKSLRAIPWLNGKLSLIRNGVDTSEIDSVKEVAKELMQFRNEGNFIIGYIGQLISRKGIDILLDAVSRLSFENWRLAIIGEGESRRSLESRAKELKISDKVCFFGFREDRIAFLRGLDLFALPSRLEGIPRCLMEAMAAGVPVIASDIPGCRDLVTHGRTGLLFPVNDNHILADRIETICSDKALRNSLALRGREFINSRFSAVRMTGEYTQLYRTLICDFRPPK
jgi:glycosyltransferase involved in cell wall biosynthesis